MLKGAIPWSKRLGVIIRAVRAADTYCRVKHIAEISRGKKFEIFLAKTNSLLVSFLCGSVSVSSRGTTAVPYEFVAAFRDSMSRQGYPVADIVNTDVKSKCALCGRKLKGSVTDGVALCPKCFANVCETLALLKKTGEFTRRFK